MRQTFPIVVGLAFALAGGAWLDFNLDSRGFSFKSFEGDGSAPRVQDARLQLEKIVPLGSSLEQYRNFFHAIGGDCAAVFDTNRFPNTITCWYMHGFFVTSEWKYVIVYDPASERSEHTELNFGLTGF